METETLPPITKPWKAPPLESFNLPYKLYLRLKTNLEKTKRRYRDRRPVQVNWDAKVMRGSYIHTHKGKSRVRHPLKNYA